MYNGVTNIFSSPDIHTISELQLPETQRLTVHDIHFAKQHHSSVTWTVATACTFTHSIQEDIAVTCDMCPALGLRFAGKLWCSINSQQWNFATFSHSSHALNNTSICHVQNVKPCCFELVHQTVRSNIVNWNLLV